MANYAEIAPYPCEQNYIEQQNQGASLDGKGKGMNFTGTVGDVVDQLEVAAENDDRSIDLWTPARVLRGVIDLKIDRPDLFEGDKVFDYLKNMTGLTRDIYEGLQLPDTVAKIKESIMEVEGLVEASANQDFDPKTLIASHPDLSQRQAEILAKTKSDTSLFMIVLAHGGVPTGIHTFMRYQELSGDEEAEVYPVRLSASEGKESQDDSTRLTNEERERIAEISKGKRVVVFDEDISSGRTLRMATESLSEITGQEVMFVANYGSAEEATGVAHRIKLRGRQLQ